MNTSTEASLSGCFEGKAGKDTLREENSEGRNRRVERKCIQSVKAYNSVPSLIIPFMLMLYK